MSTSIESQPLEKISSRPSLTHSITSGSTTADEASQTNSQLQLNPVISLDDNDTLITPVNPPSFTVHINNGLSDSPIKIQSTIDEEPELTRGQQTSSAIAFSKQPHVDFGAQTPRKGRLNLSKSMQTLRKKKEKERERASSFSEKDTPPVPSLPVSSEKSVSRPTASASASASVTNSASSRPVRPTLQTKSSSGAFSSFLRKLTGRSTPSASPTSATAPPSASISEKLLAEKEKVKSAIANPATSETVNKTKTLGSGFGTGSGLSAGKPGKPSLARLDTSSTANLKTTGLISAPAETTSMPIPASPLPVTPSEAAPATTTGESEERQTDPCQIPLPPSPSMEQDESTSFDLAPALPLVVTQPSTVNRKKAEKMQSFEGFDFDEEDEDEEEAVISSATLPPTQISTSVNSAATAVPVSEKAEDAGNLSSEVHDIVTPLGSSSRLAPILIPLRINTADGPQSATSTRSAPAGRSASTLSSSEETHIRTPLSATSAAPPVRLSQSQSPEKLFEGMKLAGSSPPRKAPVGVGSELGRKESKWRKSVMNLSEKASSKRQSVRPPPSSHDAYQAQQARIAQNRQSCAPTLHSTASIAAAARAKMGESKMSKEDQEVVETFFLS